MTVIKRPNTGSTGQRDISGSKCNGAQLTWRFLPVLAGFTVLIVSTIYAFFTTFSQFSLYDDEGTLMLTVRGFLEGNPLYNNVVSYYGPVYYFYEWILHSL